MVVYVSADPLGIQGNHKPEVNAEGFEGEGSGPRTLDPDFFSKPFSTIGFGTLSDIQTVQPSSSVTVSPEPTSFSSATRELTASLDLSSYFESRISKSKEIESSRTFITQPTRSTVSAIATLTPLPSETYIPATSSIEEISSVTGITEVPSASATSIPAQNAAEFSAIEIVGIAVGTGIGAALIGGFVYWLVLLFSRRRAKKMMEKRMTIKIGYPKSILEAEAGEVSFSDSTSSVYSTEEVNRPMGGWMPVRLPLNR
ncbi:hypothetical protein ABW19_dt0203104 [Dactylella cylindrospora]|nr:hypothetical protein ABW19_dt0203104 [Dactylella cylindrospora]